MEKMIDLQQHGIKGRIHSDMYGGMWALSY